jgi:hypothetical protein
MTTKPHTFVDLLRAHPWFIDKLKTNDDYAVAFYGSMCNLSWYHWHFHQEFSRTWRSAGGLVAELRGKGEDYIDFYCSGGEGRVTSEIKEDAKKMGFVVLPFMPDLDVVMVIDEIALD